MSLLPVRRIVPSLRKWSRYRLPPSASLGHDQFLKNFQLPINFTAVQVGDFIDQNLNQGLIEYQRAENKEFLTFFKRNSLLKKEISWRVSRVWPPLQISSHVCILEKSQKDSIDFFRKNRVLKKSGIPYFQLQLKKYNLLENTSLYRKFAYFSISERSSSIFIIDRSFSNVHRNEKTVRRHRVLFVALQALGIWVQVTRLDKKSSCDESAWTERLWCSGWDTKWFW